MQNLISINTKYNTLDTLQDFLKTASSFECSKTYDIWEQRTDSNGQMAQCLVLKKNNLNAVKFYFVNDNTVKVDHVIPNKLMQAYFGKSVKARKNIIEIIAGIIKQSILYGPQQKAFKELEAIIAKAS